ncbi:protein Hikeshi-like [Acanthaster planci]|uniref:Protein Hikeshi-like n=1 Tax=Acanthaster planci TaxID=133434 RepID=A0A8B7YT28_ACAPL|nr:protein Hikeshi-like [Acanthaster planci]
MFGCLVAGRLVQTDMQQVDPTHFVFNIENADTVNHIVVFLTGTMPFPDGMGGAIHFSWPSSEGVAWRFLGYITNEKPSAIFKISGLKKGSISNDNPFMQVIQQGQQMNTMSQIGIAVEPITQIAQQIPAENTQTSNMSNFAEFTTKMLENFYNYASSFGITQAHMTSQPDVTWVPLTVLNQWYENFKRKMTQNTNFWKS